MLVEIAFESLGVDEFSFADHGQAVYTAEGKQTGIVVDIGETQCWCQTFFQGIPLQGGFKDIPGVSGRGISHSLAQHIDDVSGYHMTDSSMKQLVPKDVKE